jgi:hypothetical protein
MRENYPKIELVRNTYKFNKREKEMLRGRHSFIIWMLLYPLAIVLSHIGAPSLGFGQPSVLPTIIGVMEKIMRGYTRLL